MAERKIIVMEGDKKVYEGPENRHTHNVAMIQMPKLMGLTPDTWIKVAGFFIAITLFYYRTDDFMKSQVEVNKYMVKFAQNSDAYHSSQTGQLFEQGKPTSWGGRQRQNFNVVQPAHAAEHNQEER